MTQELLLVDFENVQQVDVSRLGDRTNVIIFVGASQKAVPIELVASAQKLGARVEWQKVESNGSNPLLLRTGHQHRAKGTLVMSRRRTARWAPRNAWY